MKVLVIEDEPRLAELISKTFRRERIDAVVRHDGREALAEALVGVYDVIVLDRMLPSMDGLTILKELRRNRVNTPTLMLSALGDVSDRIVGLQSGADDYLGKPFTFDELIARVRALARRGSRPQPPEVQHVGQVQIDLVRRSVTVGGLPVDLTVQEYALLKTLVQHRGEILSRDQLLRRAWSEEADLAGNAVEVYVHLLRKKLDGGTDGGKSIIRTVRGRGYTID